MDSTSVIEPPLKKGKKLDQSMYSEVPIKRSNGIEEQFLINDQDADLAS